MKRFLLFTAASLLAISASAQLPQRAPENADDSELHWAPMPEFGARVSVIVDNDLCGDGDGLFHLVHQLLCTSSEVKGIVGAHVGAQRSWNQAANEKQMNNAEISAQRANEILELVGKAGCVTVKPGAPLPMTDSHIPAASEGAKLIVEEAHKATPDKPLYLLFGDMESRLRLAAAQ